MKSFKQLLLKELHESKWQLMIVAGLTLVFQFYVRFNASLPPQALFGVGWVPLIVLPFWLLWSSFYTMRHEWNRDTIYLLLSLPVSGLTILGVKLLSVLIQLAVFLAVTIVGVLVMYNFTFPYVFGELAPYMSAEWMVGTGAKLVLLGTLLSALIIMVIQFSYLAGRLFGRFQGLISIWVLFVVSWLIQRLAQLTYPLFSWIPRVPFTGWVQSGELFYRQEVQLDIAPLVASVALASAFFWLGAYLLEREIEI